MLRQTYTDDEIRTLLAEARYHLGRVLYIGEIDFNRAVSELEESLSLDSGNTAAYYHLGQAIRVQVERRTMQRAREVLGEYLRRGVPIGHEAEVREFLGVRAGHVE